MWTEEDFQVIHSKEPQAATRQKTELIEEANQNLKAMKTTTQGIKKRWQPSMLHYSSS